MYANIPSNKIALAKKFKEKIEAEFTEFVHVSYAKLIVVYPIWNEPIVAQFINMAEEKAREQTLNQPNIDDLSYISNFFQMVEQNQSLKTSAYDTSEFFTMIQRGKHLDVAVYDTSDFFKMLQRSNPLEDVTFHNTTYVCEFYRMIEKNYHSFKPKVDITNYVSSFFKMIENKQESKEPKTPVKFVTMDYIWLKIYKILTKNSDDKVVELFKLSQLKIKNSKKKLNVSLIDTTEKESGKKKILYDSSYKNRRRFRNSNFR